MKKVLETVSFHLNYHSYFSSLVASNLTLLAAGSSVELLAASSWLLTAESSWLLLTASVSFEGSKTNKIFNKNWLKMLLTT